jgi:hypothetical protein
MVTCPYCSGMAKMVSGAVIYPHRQDLREKLFYLCKPCNAYVGCHPNTDKPLGRLANAELRKAKMDAHMLFDPLWQGSKRQKYKRRGEAYKWLAEQLGMPQHECHIGMMDVADCKRVIEVCRKANLKFTGEKNESHTR